VDRPSALAHWPEIRRRLAGRRLALFLDYDGTLTPIVARPELAVLAPAEREAIRRLAGRAALVAVLSGRGREDVAALVGLSGLVYAGSHGFDIAGPPAAPGEPPVRHEVGEGVPARMERLAARLRGELAGIPGVLVEPKRYSVAVHFRLVDEAEVPRLADAVERAAREPGDGGAPLRRTGGKKVFELRPDIDWGKGEALRWLLGRYGLGGTGGGDGAGDAGGAGNTGGGGDAGTAGEAGSGGDACGDDGEGGVVPLFIGDDVTDEDAFAALPGHHGIGILVADQPRATAAQYRLRDPGEVAELLGRLGEVPFAGSAGAAGEAIQP
jgi:trehalose 6-phosphate phosphatase